jgi:hypothetical protein
MHLDSFSGTILLELSDSEELDVVHAVRATSPNGIDIEGLRSALDAMVGLERAGLATFVALDGLGTPMPYEGTALRQLVRHNVCVNIDGDVHWSNCVGVRSDVWRVAMQITDLGMRAVMGE